MKNKELKPFRFKQFEVSHARSAHKVGVDGVLLGMWVSLPPTSGRHTLHILDAGCGSGVISLMLAQRMAAVADHINWTIVGAEIDVPSAEEAEENFSRSPWHPNLKVLTADFQTIADEDKWDLIVSNPPYFDSGVTEPDTPRMLARHQGDLSPEVLIRQSAVSLHDRGMLAMIIPADQVKALEEVAASCHLALTRITEVKGHKNAPVKRALLEFTKSIDGDIFTSPPTDTLILEIKPGEPTEEYRKLGSPFYLYF